MARQAGKVSVKKQQEEKAPAKAAGVPAAREAYHPLADLRAEIDRIFDRAFEGWPWSGSLSRTFGTLEPFRDVGRALGWPRFEAALRSDVSEGDKAYEIAIELPGVVEKDLDVTVSEGLLTVRGEKKAEREEKEKDYFVSERSFGEFRRSFRLPEDVDADKVSAELSSGVLKLTLPKTPAAQAKRRKVAIKGK